MMITIARLVIIMKSGQEEGIVNKTVGYALHCTLHRRVWRGYKGVKNAYIII